MVKIISCFVLFVFHISNANSFLEKPRPQGINFLEEIKYFADVMRGLEDNSDLMQDPALTSVTREFGNSVVSIRQLPMRSDIVEATIKPWSSWWYPKRETTLFQDVDSYHLSPLSKYDIVRARKYRDLGRYTPTSAALVERQAYNSNSALWEGLCDAWSLAAILKSEPKRPVSKSGVTFSVGDLKALLLKTFEATDDSGIKYYGQKFTGDYSGWIYPDLFPEQFHRFIEVQLFQNKKSFVMDHDAGLQVWNVPVYKANYLMDKVPGNDNAVFVRMWLYSAESVQDKEFVGTKEAVREYDYVLEGRRDSNGNLNVTSGYWVKGPDGIDSRREHPDYFIRIPDSSRVTRKSWNSEIEVDIVDDILSLSY